MLLLLSVLLVFLHGVTGAIALSQSVQPGNNNRQQSTNSPKLLILGLGTVGCEVAALAAAAAFEQQQVFGTIRDASSSPKGIIPDAVEIVVLSQENVKRVAPHCSHVLVTIPPAKDDDNAYLNSLYDNLVHDLLPDESWIGVISTTGVYGDHKGKWIDEESPLLGESDSAKRFRKFEAQWESRVAGDNSNHTLCIFRCAGIYGPTRSALHTLYNKQQGMLLPATNSGGITNRIHVTDIARSVVAVMALPREDYLGNSSSSRQRVYNLADDLPEARGVVMKCAAALFASKNVNLQRQGEFPSNPSSSKGRASRRNTELKLVGNNRIKAELLRTEGLLYPTYKEGLKSILELPGQPWSST